MFCIAPFYIHIYKCERVFAWMHECVTQWLLYFLNNFIFLSILTSFFPPLTPSYNFFFFTFGKSTYHLPALFCLCWLSWKRTYCQWLTVKERAFDITRGSVHVRACCHCSYPFKAVDLFLLLCSHCCVCFTRHHDQKCCFYEMKCKWRVNAVFMLVFRIGIVSCVIVVRASVPHLQINSCFLVTLASPFSAVVFFFFFLCRPLTSSHSLNITHRIWSLFCRSILYLWPTVFLCTTRGIVSLTAEETKCTISRNWYLVSHRPVLHFLSLEWWVFRTIAEIKTKEKC